MNWLKVELLTEEQATFSSDCVYLKYDGMEANGMWCGLWRTVQDAFLTNSILILYYILELMNICVANSSDCRWVNNNWR